jgi:hypothetical protein
LEAKTLLLLIGPLRARRLSLFHKAYKNTDNNEERRRSISMSIFVHDITRGKKVQKKLPVINDRRVEDD